MPELELEDIARSMVGRLSSSGGDTAVFDALDLLHEAKLSALRRHFASAALDALTEVSKIGQPQASLLAAVCRSVDQLSSSEQKRLVDKLAGWLRTEPDMAVLLARNIASIDGLAPGPAEELVEALREVKGDSEDPDARRLLEAAEKLSATSSKD